MQIKGNVRKAAPSRLRVFETHDFPAKCAQGEGRRKERWKFDLSKARAASILFQVSNPVGPVLRTECDGDSLKENDGPPMAPGCTAFCRRHKVRFLISLKF